MADSELFVFQIFIGVITMKVTPGAQMNTNCDMLPVSTGLVHTLPVATPRKNAQIFGKMPLPWANSGGGLNWY
jgi:hypothetical protein